MPDTTISVALNLTSGQDDQTAAEMADGSFGASLAVALLFLSSLIVASNGLTILSICTTKVLKTQQNKFIIALAAADVFVGVGLLALLVQKHLRPPRGWIECQYSTAILYSSITLSLFIMVSVALDRYLFIVRPFFYRRHISSQRINACLLVQWFLASAHGFMAAYLPKTENVEKCNPLAAFQITFVKYVFPAVFCFVFVLILVLYGLIARTAKRHRNRRAERQRNLTQVAGRCCRTAGQVKNLAGKNDLLNEVPTDGSAVRLAQFNESVTVAMHAVHGSHLMSQEVRENKATALCEEAAFERVDICALTEKEANRTYLDTGKLTKPDVSRLANVDTSKFKDVDKCEWTCVDSNALICDDTSKLTYEDTSKLTYYDYPGKLTKVDARELIDLDLSTLTELGANTHNDFELSEKRVLKSETEHSENIVQELLDIIDQSVQTAASTCSEVSQYSCLSNDREDHVTHRLPAVNPDTLRSGEIKTFVSIRSLRWLRLTVIVFGLFTLCWSPTIIAILVSWRHPVPKELSSVFAMLGLANSAVNFFVYALHTRQFRRAIFRRITCKCKY